MKRILVGIVGLVLSALMVVPALDAAATRGEKCAAGELKAAGKEAAAKLRCYEAAFAQGKPVASACLAHADASFAVAFAKVEARGCATADTLAAVDDRVNGFVSGLLDMTRGGDRD